MIRATIAAAEKEIMVKSLILLILDPFCELTEVSPALRRNGGRHYASTNSGGCKFGGYYSAGRIIPSNTNSDLCRIGQ